MNFKKLILKVSALIFIMLVAYFSLYTLFLIVKVIEPENLQKLVKKINF